MVHDLEEVLAIEAARTGQTTGEATTVLQSLSGDTADFAPDPPAPPQARARAAPCWCSRLLAADGRVPRHAHREGHRRPGREEAARARPRCGSPAARRATTTRRATTASRPSAARNAIDGNRSTNWNTESYQGGFEGSHKSGVGLYVDAGRLIRGPRPHARDRHARVQGRRLRVRDRAAEPARLDPAHPGQAGQAGPHLPASTRAGACTATTCSGSASCLDERRRPRSRSCRSSASAARQGVGGRGLERVVLLQHADHDHDLRCPCPPASPRRAAARSPRRPGPGSVTSRS